MRYAFLSTLTLATALTLSPSQSTHANTTNILLSEVSIAGEQASDEFIELYNKGDVDVDLSGLQLRRRTQGGSESSIKVFSSGSTIPAHGYYLWANSQGIFQSPLADVETSSSSLANDNSIGLFTKSGKDGVLIDSLSFGQGSLFAPTDIALPNPLKNTALVRDLTALLWSNTNALTPTNSRGETWTAPVPDPPPLPPPTITATPLVRFNEILPNPTGDENEGEFIEIYNAGTSDAPLDGFHINDASKTGDYTFPKDTIIVAQGYLVLPRNVSTISLNNSNETLSLVDGTGALIDSFHYVKTKEGISLNYTATGWCGSTPTPGAENRLNTLPKTKERVPTKGYRGVPLTFDARGKDMDGDTLKYTWDFGDGHKSYKKETSHTYRKKGTYTVILTTTDGSDDVIETFSLKVESFPEANIRISALVPNPAGKDVEGEYMIIENRGKKPIDLQSFSIATGWKKLTNHPIRDSLIIKPKSEIKLTRAFSLFTLPNQKGKIELRSPDGTVLQKIKYKLDKSAEEDAVYRKEKGKRWEWQDATLPHEEVSDASEPTNEEIVEEINEIQPVESILPEETSEKQVLGATTVDDGATVVLSHDTVLDVPASTAHPNIKERRVATFIENMWMHLNTLINAWYNRTRYPDQRQD